MGEAEREGERGGESRSERSGIEGSDAMYGVPVPVWLSDEEEGWDLSRRKRPSGIWMRWPRRC
jgi:hypothetical protein